jgi:hypothetical protein
MFVTKLGSKKRGSNSWREKLIQLRASIGGTLQIILLWFAHEIILDGHDLQHVWVNHEECIKHSGSSGLSVRHPSVHMEQFSSHWMDFCEILYLSIF